MPAGKLARPASPARLLTVLNQFLMSSLTMWKAGREIQTPSMVYTRIVPPWGTPTPTWTGLNQSPSASDNGCRQLDLIAL